MLLLVVAFVTCVVAYILIGVRWTTYYHFSYLLDCCARLIVVNTILVVSACLGLALTSIVRLPLIFIVAEAVLMSWPLDGVPDE